MKPNLDSLKIEIEQYLEESGLAVFYGYSRMLESTSSVYWDCDKYPDYKLFIKAARTAGAQVIVFHQREFAADIRAAYSCSISARAGMRNFPTFWMRSRC